MSWAYVNIGLYLQVWPCGLFHWLKGGALQSHTTVRSIKKSEQIPQLASWQGSNVSTQQKWSPLLRRTIWPGVPAPWHTGSRWQKLLFTAKMVRGDTRGHPGRTLSKDFLSLIFRIEKHQLVVLPTNCQLTNKLINSLRNQQAWFRLIKIRS